MAAAHDQRSRTTNGTGAAAPVDPGLLNERLAPYRSQVETELSARIPHVPNDAYAQGLEDSLALAASRDPGHGHLVYDPIRHVLVAGGKRLRPVLCLLAAEAMCGDTRRALPTAAGLELLHTFTLVHDDVMDNDLTRRGRPTVHALWGPPIAIVAGDGLYALAFEAVADNAATPGVRPEQVIEVSRRVAQVSFELCAGQTEDVLFETSDTVDLQAYLEMIRLKTGVLIGVSLEAGAILGGAPADDVAALATFGLELGLAFQIKDDLLDLMGAEAEIGKPVGSDVRAGKKTYPVLHALEHLEDPKRQRLLEILRTPEKETSATLVAEALRILEDSGSLQAAQAFAAERILAAKTALARLGHVERPEAVALMEAVADYVVQRSR